MTAALETHNLSYAYPQHGHGLQPISFSAARGEAWVATGYSGSGKSTLARCLTGLIPHLYQGQISGSVSVDGLDTQQTPLWRLSEHVGLLFQNPSAQSLASTVEGEVLFGLEHLDICRTEMGRRLETALERFQITHLRNRSPHSLSGGEMQRLMLAAVLARQPRSLVLDEPFSMLDSTIATELAIHLSALTQQGTTVVTLEHRDDYMREIPALRHLELAPRITKTMREPLTPASVRATPTVRIRALGLRRGEKDLFSNLNLDLHGGVVTALVGANGVGKTTLLRALAGIQSYRGRVALSDGAAPQLGMMFQNADLQIFNPTVREEILYHLPNPDPALYAWVLEALSLNKYEQTAPLLLSEGQKKRLALAILLMQQPAHGVLLDEPTLGQDDHHRAIMGTVVHKLAEAGYLVVVATHDLQWAASYAERVILLAPGEIAADGPAAEVFGAPAAWERAGLVLPNWLQMEKAG